MAYEGTLRIVPGLVAAGDLSAKQFHFARITATGVAANLVAGSMCDGVIQDDPDAINKACSVAFSGVSKVVAGAAVLKGARVMCSAAARAITATSTNIGMGTALEAAAADGDLIAVLLDTKGDTLP
jgi:hypothetical protein